MRRSVILAAVLSFALITGGGPISHAQVSGSSYGGAVFREIFRVARGDSIFRLPHEFILKGTDSVWLDSSLLESGRSYLLDVRSGVLTLKITVLRDLLGDTTVSHTLTVRAVALPYSFEPSYRHREPVIRKDSSGGPVVVKPVRTFSVDDFFGAGLQKSGTIVRGLSIGSNRDLSLASGFRLQMSGTIAENIEVIAALTDENTPIQPEGTTQTLQEIDKVFVELRGPEVGATLGDFSVALSGDEFGRLNRKVQGAKGVASYNGAFDKGDVLVAGAVTRGKFTTNQFQGIEGVQGPYRLTGQNNERTIIAIAGTEHVYVNGEPMTRGAINDYTIDYGNGEITFTARRLITATSRITVDFEYTDRQYNRSLFAFNSHNRIFDGRLSLNATVARESDDKDSPIDVSLSDSDRAVLAAAGGDQIKASRSGADSLGPGKGQYKDTVVVDPSSSRSVRIFEYAPWDSLHAVYAVTFTYVGTSYGDYRKVSIGHYEFAGIGRGDYSPVRLLPMPQTHTLTDIDGAFQVSDDLALSGEYAVSNHSANSFSSLADAKSTGGAFKFGLAFKRNDITLAGKNLGSLSLDLKERYVARDFIGIDRTNEIEFSRNWNIEDSTRADEELREGLITYQPLEPLSITGGIGRVRRGDEFVSDRYSTSLHLVGKDLPKLDYEGELLRSEDRLLGLTSRWTRQKAAAEESFWNVRSGIHYENETRRDGAFGPLLAAPRSFRFNDISPFMALKGLGPMALKGEWGWRWDDSLSHGGDLTTASTSFTQKYDWELHEWKSLSSTLSLVLRDRTFSDEFRSRGDKDFKTVLMRSQARYTPVRGGLETDLFYEVASERSAKLERVFQQVPKGTGNYIYLGDVNNNHVVDEADFTLSRFDGDFIAVLVPSDALIPVTDVKASTRMRFNLGRFDLSGTWLTKALSMVSGETYVRVEEKSTEEDAKQIYLLHLSRFRNDRTTLAGSDLVQQDLYVGENSPDFTVRLRYLQRRGLTQFTLQNERSYAAERSVRLRWHLIRELTSQIDIIRKTDALSSTQASERVRAVHSDALVSDWSYRPEQPLELGFAFEVSRADNFDSTQADINDESVRLVYSFEARGQAKIEMTREEVVSNKGAVFLPFEMTGGKVTGQSWLWQLTVDYRLTQFLQATIDYNGRSENGGRIIHNGRAEVRAFF